MAITFPGIISQIHGDCISSSKRNSFSTCSRAKYQANVSEGYLVANLWFLVAKDFDLEIANRIRTQIIKFGLTDTTRACSAIADGLLLVEEGFNTSVAETIPADLRYVADPVLEYCSSLAAISANLGSRFSEQALGDILQVLRFPKRFAYPFDKEVEDAALKSFLALNNKHRGVTVNAETTLRYRILERTKYWADRICKPYLQKLKESTPFFTDGAVAEHNVRTLAEKVTRFWVEHPQYGGVLSPCYKGSGFEYDPSMSHPAVVRIVPKNYKVGRTIAMISVNKQFHLTSRRLALEACIASFNAGWASGPKIHIGDQEANQQLAATLLWASVDFSAASDSISRQVGKEILPEKVFNDIDPYLDSLMIVRDRHVPCYIFALSGTSVTWVLESIIFWCLAKACTEFVQPFFDERLLDPEVYGDDTLIDPRALGLFYEVTGMFGMRFNRSKSFSDGGYRESCGAEFYFGYDTRSIYYPRGGINLSQEPGPKLDEAVTSLMALQHRLHGAGFLDAAEYAASVVRDIYPKMTSHTPGTDCVDLWEEYPIFLKRYSQHYSSKDYRSLREGHYALTRPSDKTWFTQATSGLEEYTYIQYLQSGPQYQTELDRLLGVSTSRLDTNIRASYRSKPVLRVLTE